MTDREMLELAAKAAGIEIDPLDAAHEPDDWLAWNPIKYEGDRYRLARSCNLIIDFDGGEVRFFVGLGHWPRMFCFEKGNDEDEGRAVVEAAAEIGRAMG